MNLREYTKGIAAIIGVLIPTLNEWGIPLPAFLTVDWVNGVLLILTPVAVIVFANKNKQGKNVLDSPANTRSPALASVGALLLALVVLSGLSSCAWMQSVGVDRPEINSVSDGIVVTAADIESVATELREVCGNDQPGAPCAAGALIDSATRDEIKNLLQEAQDVLVLANRALAIDDETTADQRLQRAGSLLEMARDELEHRVRQDSGDTP